MYGRYPDAEIEAGEQFSVMLRSNIPLFATLDSYNLIFLGCGIVGFGIIFATICAMCLISICISLAIQKSKKFWEATRTQGLNPDFWEENCQKIPKKIAIFHIILTVVVFILAMYSGLVGVWLSFICWMAGLVVLLIVHFRQTYINPMYLLL
jgi:hypothetical protein